MANLAALLRRLDPAAPDPAADAALLRKYAATGDRDALAALVHRHGPLVYRVCRRLLRPDDAEDGFQATFLVLARRASSVRKAGSVGSWLVGVAGRVAQEVRRAERRRARREVALVGEVAVEQGGGSAGLECDEHTRLLHEELARLPDHLRGPLVACLLQGRTSDEAAVEFGTSPRTLRRRVEQARRVLRARLERRGVAPAVAAGLVATLGAGADAVPTDLGAKAAAVLDDFLAGGASPPAVLAQGVVTAMTRRKLLALLGVATACLTALGAGLAGGDTPPPPAPPLATPLGAPAQPPAPKDADKAPPPAARRPGPGSVRAVAGEAEHLRRFLTRYWTGDDKASDWKLSVHGAAAGEPVPPPRADEIRVQYRSGGPPASRTRLEFKDGRMSRAWVDVSGPLDVVLDSLLMQELSRVALAEHLGRPLPWWVEKGVPAMLSDDPGVVAADAACRVGLAEGRCLRLSALLALPGPPQDPEVAAAQALSVLRFLKWGAAVPGGAAGGGRDKAFFAFLVQGTGEGWDHAAKGYGFADAAALEAAWLRWMNSPESVLR